jgi:predicted dithiol-disulfide oxidoreductase (DUF899 family)
MINTPIVSEQEWITARKLLLAKEKELTHLRDELTQMREELPRVKVEKEYIFDTPEGKQSLCDLFKGNSQLFLQHFMLGPGWKEGCPGCSFMADHIGGTLPHLEHHDVSVVVVSRATLPEIEAFKKRMGWEFTWVSSNANDFNYDYHVSFKKADKVDYNYEMIDWAGEELPGISAFYKDEDGTIYHTYSSYGRGAEALLNTYNVLDLMPKGRNEKDGMQDWMKHHDKYEDAPVAVSSCCH